MFRKRKGQQREAEPPAPGIAEITELIDRAGRGDDDAMKALRKLVDEGRVEMIREGPDAVSFRVRASQQGAENRARPYRLRALEELDERGDSPKS